MYVEKNCSLLAVWSDRCVPTIQRNTTVVLQKSIFCRNVSSESNRIFWYITVFIWASVCVLLLFVMNNTVLAHKFN